jgi:hypothetical protein
VESPNRIREVETPDTLSIGAVFGGSPAFDEAWMPEIQRVMKEVISLREGVESPLCVNVVFHVEGRLLPPVEFDGVRTGRCSRRTMHLMVQAAIPAEPVEDRRAVLVGLLRDAVAEAGSLAKRRKIADDLPELRGIVDALPEN